MSDTEKVLAPNGRKYTCHVTKRSAVLGNPLTGYVYALGHRVYGTITTSGQDGTRQFSPIGKWAFCLAATAIPSPATASV